MAAKKYFEELRAYVNSAVRFEEFRLPQLRTRFESFLKNASRTSFIVSVKLK